MAGIVIGENWRLEPRDNENWELAHRHVPRRTEGSPKWNRCGKFFQADTISGALLYAADQEMKVRHKDNEVEIREALREYERILTEFREAFAESVDKLKDSTRPVRGRKK